MSVILETTIGDLVIDLFAEERPRASLNFLKLCKVKYYNYSLFHFVQRNFLAQTGDPTASGRGGESVFRSVYGDQAKYFEAETKPRIKHVKKGTVSMVNNGDDMHGSQFFITLGDNLDYLDGQHTVFGEVAEGLDVLDKLNEAICDESHRPYQDIRITHTVILDDPFDDPPGLKVPDRSPEPTKEQLDSGRIGADEKIDDTEGKTTEEIQEMIEEREFKAGTQILEMVGDIPDADIKPQENVLFVCKLNPVTTDDDLEIIFSRFGPVKSCDIIKDSVSGESLQYAFIEYENVEDCERAYFKMDNVLIDDRRIHVDFSQSVAKVVHNKPGSKPVYELKSHQETKSKLKIKDSSRKEKYDLIFEDNNSGSEEMAPASKTDRGRDEISQRNPDDRRGGRKRPGDERPRRESRERKSEERYPAERDKKRARRRDDGEDGDRKSGRGDQRSKRGGKGRTSDDEDYRDSRGRERPSRKREDRDGHRRSEERYVKSDRDKTKDRGRKEPEHEKRHDYHRKQTSEDRHSKDDRGHSRDRRGHKDREEPYQRSPEKRKQRGNSDEKYSGDNRGHDKRKGKRENTRDTGENQSSNDRSESEDECQKKKRKNDQKRSEHGQKKRYRHDSSGSDS